MENKQCPNCGIFFPYRSNKKFCSSTCRTRYNSWSRYNLLKDDVDFKRKEHERVKEWQRKNRVRYNKLMLDAYYKRKSRQELRENELCQNTN